MPFIDTNPTLVWIYDNTLGGIKRIVLPGDTNIKYIKSSVSPGTYNFRQLKNYQFITGLTGSGQLGTFSIKFEKPFKNETTSLRQSVLTNNGVKFYTYNSPNNKLQTDTLIYYGSDNSFTNSAITSTEVNEIDFLINGFREFTYLDKSIVDDLQPSGWFYEVMPGDSKPSYNVFLSATSSSISPKYSTLGSGLNVVPSSPKNYIAKYIEYDTFNLDFKLSPLLPGVIISVYLLTLDKLNDPLWAQTWFPSIIGTFSNTSTGPVVYDKLGLSGVNFDGSKNYLVFSCDIAQFKPGVYSLFNTPTQIRCKISEINIYGTYHPTSNNRLALTDTTNNPIGLSISNAKYAYTLINNGGTFSIPSRIGNGAFKAGIWENGVWNNGWRDDTISKEFDDIYLSVLTASDVSWKIEIRGATSAIDGLATGSNVSIGNIVAIDINDNRKLLKGYYQIESLGVDMGNPQNGVAPYGYIRVNLDTSFPYRRIEKDSPNHKIKVTRNIWLSGGFFNGYFSGVWNNGLFKGYPLLTEMFNSHWIDGLFDGGRFNSSYSNNYNFNKFGPKVGCSNDFMDLTFLPSNITPFLPGDYIFVTLIPLLIGQLGTDFYSGVCQIVDTKIDEEEFLPNSTTDPNPYYGGQIITINKRSIGKPTYNDPGTAGGFVYRYTASSVIQNFKFYDNNRSKIKSSDSQLSTAVFNFNSWIDVNYDSTRAVTLGRDFRVSEPLTKKSVNRNNLYGYPTYDILSSASRFRDSNSLDFKLYKLGTKYKVFTDFIGDNSQFNEPFNETDFTNFINAGWTYSYIKPGDYILKRTESLITLGNSASIALLNSGVTGDELYITASNTGLILNNNNIGINKSRYSVIEFDVITYSVVDVNYNYDNYDIYDEIGISSLGLLFSETIDSSGFLTSSYNLTVPTNIEIDDIVVMVDIYGDIIGTTINLEAPNGRIINIKRLGSGVGNRMTQTKFSLRDIYTKFSLVTSPYSLNNNTISYSDIYQMDKENNQGVSPYLSDANTLSALITGVISGVWTLYVKYNPTATIPCDLFDWSIDLKYKNIIAVDNEPTTSFPILNFNNLNYDITTQISGYSNIQTYKRMNYLPILDNVNHLLSQNTFRLDSIELATPARWGGFGKNQKTKKYEYFYNKTDMMLSINGNGATGSNETMIILDNINMYEVDMIPFFKYFEETNIYKGIQFPYIGTSPEIDYSVSDFVFIDNITIGLDSLIPTAIDTTFIGCSNVSFASLLLTAKINNTIILPYTQTQYQFVNMDNDLTPGSVTCSTTFDSIVWSITPNTGKPQPSLFDPNGGGAILPSTLYPLVRGLTAAGEYTISIVTMTKNSPPAQSIGNISATIKVASKPVPNTSVNPQLLTVSFVPGDESSNIINQDNLLYGYFNSLEYAAVTVVILTVPGDGTLEYNGNVIGTQTTITIIDGVIDGLLYYPEGLGTENEGFNTSFTYQVIDSDGNSLNSAATMNITTIIPDSDITVRSPLSKTIEYSVDPTLPANAVKYFTYGDLVQDYLNSPNGVAATRINIKSVPGRGQLSYGPNPVTTFGYDISVSDLLNGNSFGYWPQGMQPNNENDDTGGNFPAIFKYTVLDEQSNESNEVTFTLNCVEVDKIICGEMETGGSGYGAYSNYDYLRGEIVVTNSTNGAGQVTVGNIRTFGLATGYIATNAGGIHGRGYPTIGIKNSGSVNINFGVAYYDEDDNFINLGPGASRTLGPGGNDQINPGYLPGTWKLEIGIWY